MKDQQVISGTVASGSKSIKVPILLDSGVVSRGVLLFHNAPSKSVAVSIEDSRGTKLVPATPYKDWTGGDGGGYINSKKPMGFEGNRTVSVIVSGSENQTTDFNFDLLLFFE